MPRSYLNIITLDGREIRIAEFGFFADSPSFEGNGIVFRHKGKYKRIDLDSGMLTTLVEPAKACKNGNHSVRLNFTSKISNDIGYCEMILASKKSADERVLVRFMGCKDSIGENPFSDSGDRIVFFGYPADEFGE